MAAAAITAMLMPAAAVSQSTTGAAKKTTRRSAAQAQAVTADDIRQLREMLQQQQAQLNELRQQMAQRDQQLQQTQQQLSDAQKIAAEAQQRAVSVETAKVSNSALEEVKADLESVRGTMTEAMLTAQEDQKKLGGLATTLHRFRWSGDVRVRYETFFRDALADRHRSRIRARFGFESNLSEDFVAGAYLATGQLNDPTSTNESLTNAFERKSIGLDRAYITYNPSARKWLAITGGKFAATWQKTNQTFDPDINPEGFSEKLSFDVKSPLLKNVTVLGLQLSVNEAGGTNDAWAFGGQAQAKLQLGRFWTMTPSYTVLNFRNENQLVNNTLSGGTGTTGSPVTSVGVTGVPVITGFLSGSTFLAPNGMTNCVVLPAAPATTPRPSLCSKFLYSDLIVNNQITTWSERFPWTVIAEYHKNLNANPSPIDGRLHDDMYFVETSLGRSKARGDMQFGYSFGRTEQDAVIATFVESDQRWPTNVVQHRVFGNMRLRNNVTLGYTQWIGRTLNTRLPIAANGGAIALPAGFAGTGRTEPWLKRGQLDVILSF